MCLFQLLSFLFFATEALSDEFNLRGIPLSKLSLYDRNRDFTCLDNSLTIKFSQVNDDYCDCQDASDEPGTSACPNGTFHCINKGHKAKNIFSSRVNDGICDCCDGSDEFVSNVNCLNTCEDVGRAAKEENKRFNELVQTASHIYKEFIQKGKQVVLEKRQKLLELEKGLGKVEKDLLKKEAKKKSAEQIKNTLLKASKKFTEAEKENKDQKEDKLKKKIEEELQEATKLVEEATKDFEEAKSALNSLNKLIDDHKYFLDTDFGSDSEFAPLEGQCFEHVDKEYLYRLCPFANVTQHPNSSAQMSSTTSLGKWSKWEGSNYNPYEKMLFENGQSCWKGPARTTSVKVLCDVSNKILKINEPNRCEYFIEFSTPAACRPINYHDEL